MCIPSEILELVMKFDWLIKCLYSLCSVISPYLIISSSSGNNFYIHGGIEKKDGKIPTNRFYCLDSSMTWNEITSPTCPSLSHHAAVELGNRYLVLVGGWTGKTRTSNVYVYDTEKKFWSFPTVTGFPEGGGLSSHTATHMDNGVILVLGREGGLRTQRKHGSGFLLHGSPDNKQFTYSEYTQATSSRSGHTANVAASTLFIIGGRDNELLEYKSSFKSVVTDKGATEKFIEVAQKLKPLEKYPSGRKNHVTVTGQGALLIHGGETFDGKSKEPVGDMFILTAKPIKMYKVGTTDINRAGHVCGTVDGKIILHGGVGKGNLVYGDTHILTFHI